LTYSQLIGINNYNHLLIHGFFKALLFISSGYIIHKYLNIQDLRKYGFFIYYLPIEYIFILISSLSLIAFPYFSGFYTKESILLLSYFNNIHNYIFSIIGSLLTILYSLRLIYLSFYNKPNKYIINNHNFIPIYLLILIFGGLILGDLLNKNYDDFENITIIIKLLPFYLLIIGILIIKYIKFNNIFYIDELYNRLIIYFYNKSYNSFKLIEKAIFDYI
jgi:NADH:ubiquinone oxidoreductase subunit 5 (subunit L)/multisubunit Na+/H+ antiporter MnhA subunit